ncbi:MAG: GTP-binding protein [[Candidatus Thermochlorobacteriaceae] bacterium GBChlB]|jgi:GTP-binding protein|nr:MAG: GTP-binding protein [[Candidatus Thermochlorobacteriaceae] bacterium GBChlB]
MKILSAEFFKSVVKQDGLPKDGFPEIAFAGRSNVGKSSLLNMLMGKKGLAKTSATPGKTRELNFFRINQKFYFVDLPGYGYAKVSKTLQNEWKAFLESYLQTRKELKLVVLLIDARHSPMQNDLEMQQFLSFYGRRYAIARTKIDKLKASEQEKTRRDAETAFEGYEFMIDTASATGAGKHELLKKLSEFI